VSDNGDRAEGDIFIGFDERKHALTEIVMVLDNIYEGVGIKEIFHTFRVSSFSRRRSCNHLWSPPMNEIPSYTAANLTSDPELRETTDGQSVLRLSLAVTPRRREEGKRVDGTPTFLDGTVWGDQARSVASSLRRGIPDRRDWPVHPSRGRDRDVGYCQALARPKRRAGCGTKSALIWQPTYDRSDARSGNICCPRLERITIGPDLHRVGS
jgi:hypothetical protein